MGETPVAGGGVGVTVTLSDFAREHQLALTRFAFLLGGDRHYAEDVVQDVLTAMFRRFGDLLPVANPVAYARAAVVNTHLSRVRRRSLRETPREIGDDLNSPSSAPMWPANQGRPVDDVVDRDLMIAALKRLPAKSRAAVVLRFYEDLTVADVAAVLDCREGTAASLLSRAVATLQNDTTLGIAKR